MIQVFLIAFILMCVLQSPALISLVIFAIVIACIYKPNLFSANGPNQSSSIRTGESEDPVDDRPDFITNEDRQRQFVKEGLKEDFNPNDPEILARNKRIQEEIEHNRIKAARELRNEEDLETIEKMFAAAHTTKP